MREAYYHSILILIFSPLRPVLHTQMHTCSLSKERWGTEKMQLPRSQLLWGFLTIRRQFRNLSPGNLQPPSRITAGEQHRLENCVICYNMPAPPHSAISGFDTSRVPNVANYNRWKHGPLHCRTQANISSQANLSGVLEWINRRFGVADAQISILAWKTDTTRDFMDYEMLQPTACFLCLA